MKLTDVWVVQDNDIHWAEEADLLVCYTQDEAEAIASWKNAGDAVGQHEAMPLTGWYKRWHQVASRQHHLENLELKYENRKLREDYVFRTIGLCALACIVGVVIGNILSL